MDSLISRTVPAPNQLGGRPPTVEEIDLYNTLVRPKLFQLAIMIGDGCCENDILDFLCIDRNDFYAFKQLFPEFANAVNQSKRAFVEQAEKALFIAARGQFVTETEVTESYAVDDLGTETLKKKNVTKKTKFIPPQTKALELLLTNKDPDNWKKAIPPNSGNTNILQISATKEDMDAMMAKLGDPMASLNLSEGYSE